jgi:hypothetical protein
LLLPKHLSRVEETTNFSDGHWLVHVLGVLGDDMEAKTVGRDCCFKHLAGMDRVFEPGGGSQQEGKKHPCPDCSFCQFCSETRCLTCRSDRNRRSVIPCKKLSFQEQILLYEKLKSKSSAAMQVDAQCMDNSGPSYE